MAIKYITKYKDEKKDDEIVVADSIQAVCEGGIQFLTQKADKAFYITGIRFGVVGVDEVV